MGIVTRSTNVHTDCFSLGSGEGVGPLLINRPHSPMARKPFLQKLADYKQKLATDRAKHARELRLKHWRLSNEKRKRQRLGLDIMAASREQEQPKSAVTPFEIELASIVRILPSIGNATRHKSAQ